MPTPTPPPHPSTASPSLIAAAGLDMAIWDAFAKGGAERVRAYETQRRGCEPWRFH